MTKTLDKLKEYVKSGEYNYTGPMISKDDVECCIEALEKQVTKKPHLWGDGYYNGELIIDMYNCPNCNESYELYYETYDYCPKCGQKLDWSEVE